MGERRKRKSFWDKEAETKPFSGTSDSEHYHEFSAYGPHGASKFRDHSGQPSLESIHEEPVAEIYGSYNQGRENAFEGKEIGGETSYYQNMSPEFKYNHSLDNDRSHSHRYPGRGRSRSRSRSRSRTRGRSRSRSLSRGRERERGTGGSRSRSRSRNRSRSISDSDAKDWTRSRRPLGDYKHQSSGWSDRRSLPEKSKQSYSRGPRTESRGDVFDPYHGDNSKNAVPCKNFIWGKCRWGDSCRFLHHVASDETSIEGTKHSSSNKDAEHQPHRNRNPLCKYFAAGKCDRDNCRFSHEDLQFNSRDKVNNDRSSRDRGNKRNGLRWDDTGGISDDLKPSDRNNSVASVADGTADNGNSKHNDRTSHGLGNKNINWGLQQQTNNLVGFDVIDDVKDLRNTTDPVSLFGQNSHQNGKNVHPQNSSIPKEAGEETSALNETEMHPVADLYLQSKIQKLQNVIQTEGMSETNTSLSFPDLATGEHSTQYTSSLLSTALQNMTNPVMFPNQRFENEHSGKNAVTEVSISTGMVLPMESSNEHGNHMGEGSIMQSLAGVQPNNLEIEHSGRSKVQQETAPENLEVDEVKGAIGKHSETLDGQGKAEEYANKDEKGMRLFKNSLVEFVKEILKPTWKEGRMSRDVHKTIVKKVVDKITSTIQTEHIPKTQEKAEQYLSFSKPKITKLVQAYVDRSLKTDS